MTSANQRPGEAGASVRLTSGTLVLGGDWACAHGNLGALADIVHQLALREGPAMRAELLELSRLCTSSAPEATARWPAVRARLCALG